MSRYFAYGSNLSRFGLRGRAPGARPVARAVLRDYILTFESIDGVAPSYANVRPRPGARVLGALYDVTARELFALDDYEDVANQVYERVELAVEREDGSSEKAWVYRMIAREETRLAVPSAAHIIDVRDGYNDWAYDLTELEVILTAVAASAVGG